MKAPQTAACTRVDIFRIFGPTPSCSTSELAGMAPEQQKNALGERLFARISETQPEYAAKITGMLLEMDVTETLNLLESPDVLTEKINEALTVLKAHEGSLTE